jgi:DNA-binding response OmpR family regulator
MEKIVKKKYKIAVIEDEAVMSQALTEELEDSDFEVIRAFDGAGGLRMVLKEEPDLILLDIVMPEMDGMTMMATLRKSGTFGNHVPIILLTNLNVDDKILGDIARNEPAYYLVKADYTIADVVQKVKDCLSPRTFSS